MVDGNLGSPSFILTKQRKKKKIKRNVWVALSWFELIMDPVLFMLKEIENSERGGYFNNSIEFDPALSILPKPMASRTRWGVPIGSISWSISTLKKKGIQKEKGGRSINEMFRGPGPQQELNLKIVHPIKLIIIINKSFRRFLELQSSGRKDEIRLHYNHLGVPRVETFSYRLADGVWHRLAVTVSGGVASLYVDCRRVERRWMAAIPDTAIIPESSSSSVPVAEKKDNKSANKMSLWIGQRGDQHFLFKVSLDLIVLFFFFFPLFFLARLFMQHQWLRFRNRVLCRMSI